jgi:superfamily I DNA/RNA helicase
LTELKDMEAERARRLNLVLESKSRQIVIVAGAGTGKTFTFRTLLERVAGNALALTFLNALAREMAEALNGIAEARTFHSFCQKLLRQIGSEGLSKEFHVFPKLERVTVADSAVLNGGYSEFADAFRTLVEDDGRIAFFLARASYYNAVAL